MPKIIVVSRLCPDCKMLSHWPDAKFQALIQSLKKDAQFAGVVLCGACNLVSSNSSTIGVPHVYDTDNPPQGALFENLFLVPVKCSDKSCKTPAQVLAPKMSHYKEMAHVVEDMLLWRFAADTFCPSGHQVDSPGNQIAD